MLNGLFRIGVAALLALAAVPAVAGVKEGVEKWQAGDYKGAVIEWLPHAARGDPDALFNMGQAYKLGRGVPADAEKAEEFYRRAADLGHAPAQTNLGIILAQKGDKAAAAALWQKAAAKRDARAEYMLGVLYFNGDTLPKNWPLAYAYMLQANNAGLPQAAHALETMNANMPKVDRARGAEMADSAFAGDKLASSGTVLPEARRIGNPIASAPDAVQPATVRSVVAETRVPPPVASARPAVSPPVAQAQWRVQVGAFSEDSRARDAWNRLKAAKAGLVAGSEPHYLRGGNVVRLQIGGFAAPADAAALCRKLKESGQACFVVAAN